MGAVDGGLLKPLMLDVSGEALTVAVALAEGWEGILAWGLVGFPGGEVGGCI